MSNPLWHAPPCPGSHVSDSFTLSGFSDTFLVLGNMGVCNLQIQSTLLTQSLESLCFTQCHLPNCSLAALLTETQILCSNQHGCYKFHCERVTDQELLQTLHKHLPHSISVTRRGRRLPPVLSRRDYCFLHTIPSIISTAHEVVSHFSS